MKHLRYAMTEFLFKRQPCIEKTNWRLKQLSLLMTVFLAATAAVPFSPSPIKAADQAIVPSDGSPARFEWFHAVQECTAIGYHAAQTFTPSSSHAVKQIKLKLWNHNIFLNGMLTVGITATDINGIPTGNFLASGTMPSTLVGDYWTTVTIDMDPGCQVYAGTKYAIRVDSTNFAIESQVDTFGTAYTGGSFLSTDRKMTYWVDHGNSYDIWFEEWGMSSGTVPPSVNTAEASDVGTGAAILNGNLLSPGSGANITLRFEFGLTTKYGTFVPSLASGNGTFTANVSGLTPNTLYHYRAAASDDSAGTNHGADQTFTTSSGPLVRYQMYSANEDSTGTGYHAAQTFTPQVTHIAKQIKLKLLNIDNFFTDNLSVGITATDAYGMPTGNFLASGNVAGTAIGNGWTTVTIDLGSGCPVDAGTQYAIRIDSPNPDAVYARVDISGDYYTGGIYVSADRDINFWVDHDRTYDIWFEEWGIPYEMVALPQLVLLDPPQIQE